MKLARRCLIALSLLTSLTLPLSGCTSSTAGGALGIERKQLLLVSSSEVEQIAAQMYAKEIAEAQRARALDTNPVQLARLRAIAARIIPHTNIYRPEAVNWQWKVHTIKSNEMNAHVLAGGKIIFYTGLIDRLHLSDDEIAAIMGHEIAHALREHSREQISRELATQGGLSLAGSLLGLSSGQMQLANYAREFGLNLPHSRKQESEADSIGLELMARAGYNPNAAISVWHKLNNVGGGRMPQFMSTHPNPDNRIKAMQALIPNVMPLYEGSNR